MPLPRAREILVSDRPHATLTLQGVQIRLDRGKTDHSVQLLDSTGLGDRVHPEPAVRAGMAQALRTLREADAVLHMVDAALAGGPDPDAAVGEVDRQIAAFAAAPGPRAGRYAVLANKTDLPPATAGVRRVRAAFPGQLVIPVSARTGAGFREVRLFVADRL